MAAGTRVHHYQPAIIRSPTLIFLLVITLILIALTEVAVRRLPAHSANGLVSSIRKASPSQIDEAIHRRHAARQLNDTEAGSPDITTVTPSAPPEDEFLPVSSDPTNPTSAANADNYLPVTSKVTYAPASSNYVPVQISLDSPSSDSSPATVTPAPSSSDYLPVTNPTFAPNPDAFLPVTSSASAPTTDDSLPVTSPPGAPSSENFLPVSSSGPAFIPVSLNLSPSESIQSIPTSSDLPTAPQAPPPTQYLPVTGSSTFLGNSAGAPGPTNYIPVSNPTVSATGSGSSVPVALATGTVAGVPYTVGLNGAFHIDGGSFNISQPTTATLHNGDVLVIGPTGAVSLQDNVHHKPTLVTSVTPKQYVLGAFVPTILAVLFSIPWHLITAAIKEMEPFYQLHGPDGALAEDSLTLDYRASIGPIATVTAMRKGHFLVWWTGLTSLMVLLIAPLASETVFIGFVGSSTCTATSGRARCFPELSVFPPAARAIQGILAFVAVMTLGLLIALWRVRSGVVANPLSIAGTATLFQHQPLIDLFQQIGSAAPSTKQLRTALRGVRCRTGEYAEIDGSTRYGIHLVSNHGQPREAESVQVASDKENKYATVSVALVEETSSGIEPRRSFSSYGSHPAIVAIFGLFVCGLIALIVYYKLVGKDTGFERFMDSQSFGVGFLFTAIGVVIKLYWNLMDDETRLMEPYRNLQQGSAHPRHSILLAPHSNPFTGAFHSLRHGHFFNAYYSFVAILCEPLIVCLANIPFKPGTAFLAYTTATWVSTGILVLMIVGIIWRLFRKNVAKATRRPDTMAGIMFQICGSHMLGDFRGMAQLKKRTRDDAVRSWGKRYNMGHFVGTDGMQRMGVDEDMFF